MPLQNNKVDQKYIHWIKIDPICSLRKVVQNSILIQFMLAADSMAFLTLSEFGV